MDDLLGRSRVLDAMTEVVLHGETPAAFEVRGKAAAEILLPPCPQDRVSVAGFGELQLDDSIQDRPAIVGRRLVAATARQSDGAEYEESEQDGLTRAAHRFTGRSARGSGATVRRSVGQPDPWPARTSS